MQFQQPYSLKWKMVLIREMGRRHVLSPEEADLRKRYSNAQKPKVLIAEGYKAKHMEKVSSKRGNAVPCTHDFDPYQSFPEHLEQTLRPLRLAQAYPIYRSATSEGRVLGRWLGFQHDRSLYGFCSLGGRHRRFRP